MATNAPSRLGRGRARTRPGNLGEILRISRSPPRFGVVPDALLLDRSLSLRARALLAYLIGRPADWTPVVGQLCSSLGITDFSWRGLRIELEAADILTSHRLTGSDGRFVWELVVNLERYGG